MDAKRPCACGGLDRRVPNETPPGDCHWCLRWKSDNNLRTAMGGVPVSPPGPALPEYPCPHRHERAPERETGTCAEGCQDGTRVPLFVCSVFGLCSVYLQTKEGFECCRDCNTRPGADGITPAKAIEAAQTDKHTHRYGAMYNEILRNRKVLNLLEIGVLEAKSLAAWSRLYPAADLVGIDNNPACAAAAAGIPRTRVVQLDAGNRDELERFAAANRERFDVIVDDASHFPEHQLLVRRVLWNALAPGGVMVIEDITTEEVFENLRNMNGRAWDFRGDSGKWDSRCVTFEKSLFRPDGRPRVLFASQDLSLTGAPILLANLLPRLRNLDVSVVSRIDGPLRERYERAGISVVISSDLSVPERPDLVVVNTIAAANAVRAARGAGVPCVWMIHESDPAMCGNLDEVRELIGYPELLIFPCRATAAAYAGLRTRGVAIVPTLIPPPPVRNRDAARAALGIVPGEFVVLSMGTEEPRKGHSDIREAIFGLEGVRFLAVAGTDDPWTHYAAADLYVCSSRVEAYPLALQEAKAYGLPVITTPVFGCSEIIRNRTDGLHYAPGDIADLRKKILMHSQRTGSPLPWPSLRHLPSYDEMLVRYEEIFRSGAGRTPRPAPAVRVVYHVAGMGSHWRAVVTEQLTLLAESGLRRADATHVGEGAEWLAAEAVRLGIDLTICQSEPDPANCEVLAMRLIERLARSGDAPILYLHTKGVSHPPEETVWSEWRRLMEEELIRPWASHIAALADHDAVGVNWWVKKAHFSGNFWIVRPDWIRRLPKFNSYYKNRYSCERWIGAVPGIRAKSLACTDLALWDKDREWLTNYWADRNGVCLDGNGAHQPLARKG